MSSAHDASKLITPPLIQIRVANAFTPLPLQIRVANAFKRAGYERHRRLSLLAEASSHQPGGQDGHWWTKKTDLVEMKGPAHQPLLEEDADTNV